MVAGFGTSDRAPVWISWIVSTCVVFCVVVAGIINITNGAPEGAISDEDIDDEDERTQLMARAGKKITRKGSDGSDIVTDAENPYYTEPVAPPAPEHRTSIFIHQGGGGGPPQAPPDMVPPY